MFEPLDKAIRGIPIHASINNLLLLQACQIVMGIGIRIDGGQKRERPWCGDTLSFVLDVVNDHSVDRKRLKSHELPGHDLVELP